MSVLGDVIIPEELSPLPVYFLPIEYGGQRIGASVEVFFYPTRGGYVFGTVYRDNQDTRWAMPTVFVPDNRRGAPE